MMEQNDGFSFNRMGTTGHEIRDPDGLVIGWTVDEMWAAVIAALLNCRPWIAAGSVSDVPEQLVAAKGLTTETNTSRQGV